MNWLVKILSQNIMAYKGGKDKLIFSVDPVKEQIKEQLLNLIEQSKDKDLPLHWLAGEITKL